MTGRIPTVTARSNGIRGRELAYDPGKFCIQLRIRQSRELDKRSVIVARQWVRRWGHRHGYLLGTIDVRIVRSLRDNLFDRPLKDEDQRVLRITANMIVNPWPKPPRPNMHRDLLAWEVEIIDEGRTLFVPVPSGLGDLVS